MSYPARWYEERTRPVVDSPDDHSQLLAWEAELAAERAPIDQCDGCYDPATGEFGPSYPCAHCRAQELAGRDRDGHDDKRETPRGAA